MKSLSIEEKLQLLGEQASYDVSAPGPSSPAELVKRGRVPHSLLSCIYPAAVSGGHCVPVLKVLVTNVCYNDCRYCATRCSADVRRVSFRPEELARAFMAMEERRLVRGLFLSSGMVGSPDQTQALIVDTAKIVRQKYGYRGYLHLKIVPGASEQAISETVKLANRVSVNLEAPAPEYLGRIAPDKQSTGGVMATLQQTTLVAREYGIPSGVTTQFVAGAAGEPHRALLAATWRLYKELKLRRIYYSGFRPVEGSPLQDQPPLPGLHQHRLYQADFLLRQYGFTFDDLVFDEQGNLPEGQDPKLAWAAAHPDFFPVDLATADLEELLRVPGLGPITARRLLQARSDGQLGDWRAVKRLGVRLGKAGHFITLGGRLPGDQLSLSLNFGSAP